MSDRRAAPRSGSGSRSGWGTSLENVLRDVRYASRSFVRAPLAAATIIVTVGLGLGLVAAVYTILNSMLFEPDDVRDPYELFALERQQSAIAEPQTFTREDYEALLRETDAFSEAFATTRDASAWIEGIRREGRLVTGNFFGVLGVSALRGRTLTPADDEPGSPPVLVLSHRAWVQHYAADPDVIDRTLRVNGAVFRVIGIMPETFRGLEIIAAPDFWAAVAQGDSFSEPGSGARLTDNLGIVGRLAAGVSSDEALAQLTAWDTQRTAVLAAERRASFVLEPRPGTVPQPAEAMLLFTPLLFAFGLILMIGCANVANLLLARLLARQREIGVRMAIGASRLRVVRQLLTECLLLGLVAAALGYGVARASLTGIVYWITSSFPPDIGNLRLAVPAADWRVVLFLLAGALVSTVFFALAPALRATRQDVARAIHGQVLGERRPGRARSALVALQVAGSALLLICAAIFLRGAWESASIDPGFRTADIVSVSVLNESRRPAILDTVRSAPTVAAHSAVWPGVLGGAPAYAEGARGRSLVSYQFVSPEHFGVLDLDLARGRGFADGERSPNEAVAVVSESVARELWPGVDGLGQVLRVEPDPTIVTPYSTPAAQADNPMFRPRTAVVVGILRDIPGIELGNLKIDAAGVYMPISAETAGTSIVTRVRGDVDSARRSLTDDLAAIDPNMSEVTSLRTLLRAVTYILGTSFWLTLVLALLALLLTTTGLFSVLSYLVEQRRREIGVRMALGATSRSVGRLVLVQLSRPVGVGLALGSCLTLGLAALLRSAAGAEAIGSAVRLFDPFAYGASVLCIVAACLGAGLIPALRAARVNPLAALRQD